MAGSSTTDENKLKRQIRHEVICDEIEEIVAANALRDHHHFTLDDAIRALSGIYPVSQIRNAWRDMME